MALQTLNTGTAANDGTGDNLRVGGDKINDNFSEIYISFEIDPITIIPVLNCNEWCDCK